MNAPLPDDVAKMVERLCYQTRYVHGLVRVTMTEAADMLERLARQVPEGCVVVPREPTTKMMEAGMFAGLNAPDVGGICSPFTAEAYDTYKAMIAAGEVKP